MEEQGKAATTISRMMAAMKAFFNYECMQACIRRNPAESLHAPKVEKKAPVILSVESRVSAATGTAIRADAEGDPGRGDARLFYMRPESGCQSL